MTEEGEGVRATNDSSHYECRPSLLRMENAGSCAFTRTLKKGQIVTFISAHAEGKLLFPEDREDRKSTRLNSSHLVISYAVFCLKKKKARYPRYGRDRQEPFVSRRVSAAG